MSNDDHFISRIKSFNEMYSVPTPDVPVWNEELGSRLAQFKSMLKKEVSEVDDIDLTHARALWANGEERYVLDTMVGLADWLIDIVVYCLSEATRHGIPIKEVFDIVMDSNASKLDENGNPIIENGKIMKGPNYWKPEPKIRELLKERMYGHLRVEAQPRIENQSSDVGGMEHKADGDVPF